MAQGLELSDLEAVRQPEGTDMNGVEIERSVAERRLLRLGILTLAVLCVAQAALNISLRFALHSQEAAATFPLSSSAIEQLCQSEQSQRNISYLCSCYKGLVGTPPTSSPPSGLVTCEDHGSGCGSGSGSGFNSLDGFSDLV